MSHLQETIKISFEHGWQNENCCPVNRIKSLVQNLQKVTEYDKHLKKAGVFNT